MMKSKESASTPESSPSVPPAAQPRGSPPAPEPPPVALSVDVSELVLNQVVGFATRFVQTVAATHVARHGIGLPEVRALFLLGRHGRLAPIRLAELATTDRATITRALRVLAERDLVTVAADPDHRRRTFAQLTPAGAALHDRIARFVLHRNAWLKHQLGEQELATLLGLLRRLEALSRRLPLTPDEEPPQRPISSGARPGRGR